MNNIVVHLKFGSCCRKEDRVYFYNMSFNAVFFLDVRDLSLHFVHRFSHEAIDKEKISVNGSLIYENSLYFFPNNADTNAVMRYDLKRQQEYIIPIENYCGKKFRVADFVQFGDMVYLFPSELKNGVYLLDLQKQKVKKEIELGSLFRSGFLCGSVCKTSDDCILLNMNRSNQLIKIDLHRKELVGSWTIGENIQIASMHFDGQSYWFLQAQSPDIYEWDCKKKLLQKYTGKGIKHKKQDSIPYANIIFSGTEILILGYSMKSILRVDKAEKIIEEYIPFPKELQLVNKKYTDWPICFQYDVFERCILFYPILGNMLLIYDKENHQVVGREIAVSEAEVPYLKDVLENIMMEKNSCIENDELETLERFINVIEAGKRSAQIFSKKNAGNLIYQQIRDCL